MVGLTLTFCTWRSSASRSNFSWSWGLRFATYFHPVWLKKGAACSVPTSSPSPSFLSWFGNFIYHANRCSHSDVSDTKHYQWTEAHIYTSPLSVTQHTLLFKPISLNNFSLTAPALPKATCPGCHHLQVASPYTQSKWINIFPLRLPGRREFTGVFIASQHIPQAVPALSLLSVVYFSAFSVSGTTFWLAELSESWALLCPWILMQGRDPLLAAPSLSSWNPQHLWNWPLLERAHRHIKTV